MNRSPAHRCVEVLAKAIGGLSEGSLGEGEDLAGSDAEHRNWLFAAGLEETPYTRLVLAATVPLRC